MHAFKTKGSLLTLTAVFVLCQLLSACGQKGPLTLPQPPAEVATPTQNEPPEAIPQPDDKTGDH